MKQIEGQNVRIGAGLLAVVACLGMFSLSGCERKERVVDVQTPIGDVKVDKTVDDGDVDVKVNTK